MRCTPATSPSPAGTRATRAALLALALAGCGTTPPTHFYVLTPLAEAPASAAPAASAAANALVVGIDDVNIPGIVDRPQIVTSVSAHERHLEEFQRWAEPLDDAIARVLRGNLSVLLAPTRVVHDTEALGVSPGLRVSVALQRFEVEPDGACVLEACWAIHAGGVPGEPSTLRADTFRSQPDGTGPDALAAAQSRNLLELSRAIAAAIRKPTSS